MLMSAIDDLSATAGYPELAGKRVLITGMSRAMGVDVARAFADLRARLVLQFDESGDEMQALAEHLSETALDVAIFENTGRSSDDCVRFARAAVTRFGGLDAVINIVPLAGGAVHGAMTPRQVEAEVAERLLLACVVSRVAANRMRMTMTDGLILHVATLALPASAAERAFASYAKSALAAVTRRDAVEWADKGIRFNAIAPDCTAVPSKHDTLASESDIAALALYLASGRGKALSGHIFDAALAG